jgi:hypothetical protein
VQLRHPTVLRIPHPKAKWAGGLAQWEDHATNTVYLSVVFTWELDRAYAMAVFARNCGKRVVAGGPALFLRTKRHLLDDVAEIPLKTVIRYGRTISVPGDYGDAIRYHNPSATFASRGCPVGCFFCLVPAMEGREFTLLPDFPVRPILCDNNLSALPPEYQDHIIERYAAAGVPLLDANSGFEPITFTQEVYERWAPLINAGRGPWRFAYDETKERGDVIRVMQMLDAERPKRKRVYVLVGNEPFAECMQRIQEVIDHGCEPHVQPYMKLSAAYREPHVQFDWTLQKLRDVARWADGFVWKRAPFIEYDRYLKSSRSTPCAAQHGLFA